METTIRASSGPEAARLALKFVEWAYGSVCKVTRETIHASELRLICIFLLKETLLNIQSSTCTMSRVLLQEVASTLIKYGRQSLAELLHLSKLRGIKERTLLKKALIVLIQQNCVDVYMHTNHHDPQRSEHVYEACIERMLQINRMPRFVDHVKREMEGTGPLGSVASATVEVLLHHGRLRMAQLASAVASTWHENKDSGPEPTPQMLKQAVEELADKRYIERVPPCLLPPPGPRGALRDSKGSKRKTTQSRLATDEEESMLWDAEVSEQRARYAASRFDLTGAEAALEVFSAPESLSVENSGPKDRGGTTGKRKRGATEVKLEDTAAVVPPSVVPRPVLWRVNYEEFNRRFLVHEIETVICREHAAQPGSDSTEDTRKTTVTAIRALLAAAVDASGRQGSDELLLAVMIEDVRRALQALPALAADAALLPSDSQLHLTLVAVASQPSGLVVVTEGAYGTSYRVNTDAALGMARRSAIMSTLGHKYGKAARRIWNMLLLEQQMEQKAVAECAMVSNAEAREALYALLKDGFISLQDIPRNPDRAPSRTSYTWRANLGATCTRMAINLYKAAGNLMTRLATEAESRAELCEMVEMVSSGLLDVAQLDRAAVEQMRRVMLALETAAVRLDVQMSLFENMG